MELSVIENLGLKMYSTIPPVISEIIANSWDADSTLVQITLPTGDIDKDSEIIVEDDGIGMSDHEIGEFYLRIGRKRREEEGKDVSPGGRTVIGRKGIGKLAPFGVAKIVEVETCRDHIINSFVMSIDDILEAAKNRREYYPITKEYKQTVEKESGTKITLKSLNRTSKINIEDYRKGIAKRFSIIKGNFTVEVNGKMITPEDWITPDNMQYLWEVPDQQIDAGHPDWRVKGWIGTTLSPLSDDQRGVIIMARGKLCQDTPFFFGANIGVRHTYAYVSGIINAEFLDKEEDNISTHRASVVWESPQGSSLLQWGKAKLEEIALDWVKKRRQEREKVIREDPEFKTWLDTLPKAESKLADKVITAITSDEHIDDERRVDLAKFMKNSFEQRVFQEMIASLPDNPEDAKLIEVFQEWGVIEAREILRIVEGRLSTIEQFVKFIKDNAREVPTIHNFFKEWPWILDPTWTQWNDEIYFSQLLKENFPDEKLTEPNRRIDFVCIGAGDTVHVIELKRPLHKIDAEDLEQLLRYVAFIRERLGNFTERSYRDASGYILAGSESDDYLTREKKKILSQSRIYVRRYDELITVAYKLHEDFRKKLREFESKNEVKKTS